jgi:hypothetical protein
MDPNAFAGRSAVPGATGALVMVQRFEWFVAPLYIVLTAVALAPAIARQALGSHHSRWRATS